MRDRTGHLGKWLALREGVALLGSTGGPLRLARAGPGFAAHRSWCQATIMKGAESVCKGKIMTMDCGHDAVQVELERGEGH